MRTPLFQLDAFTNRRFSGNPAAVMPMDRFPDDAVMQALAAENNPGGDGVSGSRGWGLSVAMVHAGHGSAALWACDAGECCGGDGAAGAWANVGGVSLEEQAADGDAYEYRVCARFSGSPSEKISALPALTDALRVEPVEVFVNAFNYMAVLESAGVVHQVAPDMVAIARLDRPGVIVTAAGDGAYDCVSRFTSLPRRDSEDPVTGAAHCMLAPYWAARLGKSQLARIKLRNAAASSRAA